MTDFLFAHPSTFSGVARVLDLGGFWDRYNASPTPEVADQRALMSDVLAVERDLQAASRIVLAETREQETPTP